MLRLPLQIAFVTATLLTTGVTTGVTPVRTTPATSPTVTREIIAVYFGTEGTDAQSGMIAAVRNMRTALQHQAGANGQRFILRGVSLEPGVDDGIRDLALFGVFDEISVGGNWTNAAVVTYLGPDMSNGERAAIPQVVLLERQVSLEGPKSLSVGPEREIGRYIGRQISSWVDRGAPLPR